MADYAKAYPAPPQRRAAAVGGRKGMNVNTVDLHSKGITVLSETEDGHRVYTCRHRASGLTGKGGSLQAAYDALAAQL
jgi:hypothetical protein